MYYLYSESKTGFYLMKAEHYDYLLPIVNRCKLRDWSIGDQPINYEDKEYYQIDSKFLEQSTEQIIEIARTFANSGGLQ